MGLSSILIYTSELILCSTICVPSATRHIIHMYSYFLMAAINHLKSSRTFSVRPRSSVSRVTVDLIRRSWVRFPPRSKDFFFASCGSLFSFTRANAQRVIHGFKEHFNLHFRVNSLFHYSSPEKPRKRSLSLVLQSLHISEEASHYKPWSFLRSPPYFLLLLLLLLLTVNLCKILLNYSLWPSMNVYGGE